MIWCQGDFLSLLPLRWSADTHRICQSQLYLFGSCPGLDGITPSWPSNQTRFLCLTTISRFYPFLSLFIWYEIAKQPIVNSGLILCFPSCSTHHPHFVLSSEVNISGKYYFVARTIIANIIIIIIELVCINSNPVLDIHVGWWGWYIVKSARL